MILWRISEFASLDGAGGIAVEGRWHSAGRPIVYTAESSALAMLEILVHLEVETIPTTFQLLKIEAPDGLEVVAWSGKDPADEAAARAWGDAWLERRETALARVPSIIAPASFNWLINPAYADASQLKIVASARWPWDSRLFRT